MGLKIGRWAEKQSRDRGRVTFTTTGPRQYQRGLLTFARYRWRGACSSRGEGLLVMDIDQFR